MGSNVVYVAKLDSPLGEMIAASTDDGIVMLEFLDGKHDVNSPDKFILDAEITEQPNEYLIQLNKELLEYFAGQRQQFEVNLNPIGSEFQMSVWNALLEIPYGETRTYKEQTDILGNPKAIRAVATANSANKIAIVIPCHRVIGSDGSLTGYAGGLERKHKLLEHEKRYASSKTDEQVGLMF